MSDIILNSPIVKDEYTAIAEQMFDFVVSDVSSVSIQNNINLPEEWNIGLIHGPSGCGKITLLKTFGEIKNPSWDNSISCISNMKKVEPKDAAEIFCSVGFATVPSWIRPYEVLSNGEKFRADLAKNITETEDLILVDEFTSVIDRNVAKSASNGLQKFIRRKNKKIILSSCHSDIIEWLQPDWTYNPIEGETRVFSRGSLRRPNVSIEICRVKYEAWNLFKHHHYLSKDLNRAAKCFVAYLDGKIPIAFCGVLSFPHAIVKRAWRESRLVVLPDYQGLGVGVKFSDYIGSLIRGIDGQYYSKTIHPAMIAYRTKNKNKWKETGNSRTKSNPSGEFMLKSGWTTTNRPCYAFKYIGEAASEEEVKLFTQKV